MTGTPEWSWWDQVFINRNATPLEVVEASLHDGFPQASDQAVLWMALRMKETYRAFPGSSDAVRTSALTSYLLASADDGVPEAIEVRRLLRERSM